MENEETTTITLSRDEALVLHDLLFNFDDEPALQIVYPAQRYALHNLECLLEKELAEPFRADYGERLEIAKKNLTW